MTFGEKLKEARKGAGMTQEQQAKTDGSNLTSCGMRLHGQNSPMQKYICLCISRS